MYTCITVAYINYSIYDIYILALLLHILIIAYMIYIYIFINKWRYILTYTHVHKPIHKLNRCVSVWSFVNACITIVNINECIIIIHTYTYIYP